jgi:Rrf2 family protein
MAASLAAGAQAAVDALHTRVMRLTLTKRGDYAVRAMLALARAPDGRLISVRRIAEEMTIPVRFLPQVMGDLVAAGLVEATTGRAGGYRLARPATEVSLLDVVEAVEGDSRRRMCVLRGGPCGLDGHCDVHDVFIDAQDAMLEALGRARLAELPVRRGGHLSEVGDRSDSPPAS